MQITEQPGESPDPPLFDYDTWGRDENGNLHHSLYSHWWPRSEKIDRTFIELECYREARSVEEGGLGRYGHLMEAIDALWNSGGRNNVEINPWVERILEMACENEHLGIAGASSTSKSFCGAILAWVHVLCDPARSMSLVTSTSIQASKKRIWKSVIFLHNNLPKEYRAAFKHKPSANMFHWQRTDGKISDDSCGITLIASEKKQEANAVAKLVGLKADRVLLCADELCELSHSVVAACDNLMSNPEFQMVAMSNPKDREDPFGVYMEPVDGWNSIGDFDFEWKTKMGMAIRLDAIFSPNFMEKENVWKNMMKWEKIESARDRMGETSARFYRFFRGAFPIQGQEDCLYNETDFMVYMKPKITWGPVPPIKIGSLDTAGSSGGDRNILMISLFGRDAAGIQCLEYDKHFSLKENAQDKATTFGIQISQQVVKHLKNEDIDPKNFGMDNTGNKQFAELVIQEIEKWKPGEGRNILRIEFGGKASDRPVSANDRTEAHKRFDLRVSELWAVGQEYLRGGQWAGLRKCPELMAELKARRFEMKKSGDGERLRVESKKEMRLRANRSPDLGDAWMIAGDICRQRFQWRSHERGLAVLPANDYDEMLRSLDVAALSSGGQPDWVPSAA